MADSVYEDSFVTLFTGPRRGGKSASQAYVDMCALLAGKRVFADSPVSFDFQVDDNSPVYHYETEPLNYVELIFANEDPELKKKYMNSLVSWDEVDKWLFSRNFQSVFSKIQSQFITLIGKLEMSFTMTAQFIHLVDKNIRLQVDSQCRCVDLSFKYPQLHRGTTIGQSWQDKSGKMTGTEYDYSQEEYQQTFHANTVWPIYDTKHAPSLIESMQKIEIKQQKKIITVDEMGKVQEPADEYKLTQVEQNKMIINLLAEEIKMAADSNVQSEFTRMEVLNMARQRGFRGTNQYLIENLANEGVINAGRRGILVPM